MIRSSILIPSYVLLFILVSATLAKFTQDDRRAWTNPLDLEFRLEFLPDGDQITEFCWVQGPFLGNATIYGGITDCFPHNWHCVIDGPKLLTPKLRNIQCIEKDVVSNPSEFICSYRWFFKRNSCDDEKVNCFRIMMACEHKYHQLRSNILVPIFASSCVGALIVVCVFLTYKHYRYINLQPIDFSLASPEHYESQEIDTFIANEPSKLSFMKKTDDDVNKMVPETQEAVANVVHHTMV